MCKFCEEISSEEDTESFEQRLNDSRSKAALEMLTSMLEEVAEDAAAEVDDFMQRSVNTMDIIHDYTTEALSVLILTENDLRSLKQIVLNQFQCGELSFLEVAYRLSALNESLFPERLVEIPAEDAEDFNEWEDETVS